MLVVALIGNVADFDQDSVDRTRHELRPMVLNVKTTFPPTPAAADQPIQLVVDALLTFGTDEFFVLACLWGRFTVFCPIEIETIGNLAFHQTQRQRVGHRGGFLSYLHTPRSAILRIQFRIYEVPEAELGPRCTYCFSNSARASGVGNCCAKFSLFKYWNPAGHSSLPPGVSRSAGLQVVKTKPMVFVAGNGESAKALEAIHAVMKLSSPMVKPCCVVINPPKPVHA